MALAAPIVFTGYWEYQLSLACTGILALAVLFFDRESSLYNGQKIWVWLPLLLVYSALIASLLNSVVREEAGTIAASRSFHGLLHIAEWEEQDKGTVREMYHGGVIHGIQYTANNRRNRATSYYGKGTGGWLAVQHHPRRAAKKPLQIGVLGLGTGTIAALGRQGDTVRFYEINPDVVRLSREWFSYLQDTEAHVEIVLGDARIHLERELKLNQEQQFDVLIADAFSSDAIPLHLLTKECGQVYRHHLKDDGILAIHISNQYLDLIPVTVGLAKELGWEAVLIDSDDNLRDAVWAATWVLITKNETFLASPAVQGARTKWPDGLPPAPLVWTDDYTSLFHVLN